jgi:general secretion pathway protein D
MALAMRRGSLCSALGVVLASIFLAACQKPPPPPRLQPLAEPTRLQPATPRVSGTIPNRFNRQRAFIASSAPVRPEVAPAPASPPAATGKVTLDFVDTDIREIARTILGKLLKVNFTIDPSVKGTASIQTGKSLPRSALLPTLETLLNQNGATIVAQNGLYRVMPLAAGAVSNSLNGAAALGAGTEVVALRYASAPQLAKTLAPYVAGNAKIAPDPMGSALIVSGDAASRAALVRLIHAFDIDVLAGQSYALLPAGDAGPEKLAKEIASVLQAQTGGPLANLVRVLPMDRVNAVLVISSQPQYIEAATRVLRLAHRVETATARSWHVYYVQNGEASDLQYLLQQAFTPEHVTAAAPTVGKTAPALPTITMTGTGQTAGTSSTSSQGLPGLPGAGGLPGLGASQGLPSARSEAPSSSAAGATRSAATEPLSPTTETTSEAKNRIRIIADARNNALLIYATPSEYEVIQGMLRKLDVIPLQVLIQATIAEVDLNAALQYGTQWAFQVNGISGVLSQSNSAIFANTGAFGFPGFVIGKSQQFVLNALSQVTKVKVLSSPEVMVLDNQPARLQVGQQVPVLTGTATSTLTTGAPIVNSISYHETGIIMQVIPRVNSDGLVTLDISQEVSDVAAPAANTASGSPTFNDQVFLTRVAVQNGDTVGMAGLIRDNASQSNGGIPWLKDIPLIGSLVSSQANSRKRTELLVLITPHVVHDQRDARELTEDMRTELSHAALIPQTLKTLPLPGRSNPQGF